MLATYDAIGYPTVACSDGLGPYRRCGIRRLGQAESAARVSTADPPPHRLQKRELVVGPLRRQGGYYNGTHRDHGRHLHMGTVDGCGGDSLEEVTQRARW